MGLHNPTFITKNRLGIFIFQMRIPVHVGYKKRFYRKSLRTRDRKQALAVARRLKVMWDEIAERLFDDKESYNRAMKILDQYDVEATHDWQHVEAFLMKLDDWESHLLEQGINYRISSAKWHQHHRTPSEAPPASPETPPDPHTDDQRLEQMEKSLALLTQYHTPLNSKPVSDLIDEYLNDLKKGWNIKNIDNNLKDIKPKLSLFSDFVGNINSDQLTKDHVVSYRNLLKKYPRNKNKMPTYRDLSVADIAQMDIPDDHQMSATSKNNYANRVSGFLNWLSTSNYSKPDLKEAIGSFTIPPKAPHEERPEFTDEELTRLFNSKQYVEKGHDQASHYWVPLLAIYTGARQGELCQLHRSDVYKDDKTGIWVIYINQQLDKKTKRVYHARHIPIHPQIIKMGFLDYLDSINSERVFPDLTKKRDGYGQQFSRWFCRTYINKNNCNTRKETDDPDGVFHSFRHNFITKLDHDQNIAQHQIAHLTGQKPTDGSVTTSRYIKPHLLKQRKAIIDKIQYPSIDFSKIRHWKRGFKRFSEH